MNNHFSKYKTLVFFYTSIDSTAVLLV